MHFLTSKWEGIVTTKHHGQISQQYTYKLEFSKQMNSLNPFISHVLLRKLCYILSKNRHTRNILFFLILFVYCTKKKKKLETKKYDTLIYKIICRVIKLS